MSNVWILSHINESCHTCEFPWLCEGLPSVTLPSRGGKTLCEGLPSLTLPSKMSHVILMTEEKHVTHMCILWLYPCDTHLNSMILYVCRTDVFVDSICGTRADLLTLPVWHTYEFLDPECVKHMCQREFFDSLSILFQRILWLYRWHAHEVFASMLVTHTWILWLYACYTHMNSVTSYVWHAFVVRFFCWGSGMHQSRVIYDKSWVIHHKSRVSYDKSWVTYHKSETCHIHLRHVTHDMTHCGSLQSVLFARKIMPATWFIICDMPYWYVWHDSDFAWRTLL